MKVPGSDGNVQASARVQDGRVGESSVQRKGSEKSADTLAQELGKQKVDTVTLSSLGSLLGQELNPARMLEERKAKVESLKEQIRKGSYAPPLGEVAKAVGEEISLEVLLGGDALQDGESR